MVVYMISAYLVAWLPYAIFALMETFVLTPEKSLVSPAVATLPSLFAKTSVVFNPLVYGLLNTQVILVRIRKQAKKAHSYNPILVSRHLVKTFHRQCPKQNDLLSKTTDTRSYKEQ